MVKEATDMELANFLIKHIEEPCVDPKTGCNIREFYIREAERAIKTFTDPIAEKKLRDIIKRYK